MGYRRTPFAPGEWYHLFSRGIDKRDIFLEENDFKRFQKLLYLANDVQPVNLAELKHVAHEDIFRLPRKQAIVSIAAYCLMRNHPHLVVREKNEGGITAFMHKLGTAYTTYFNVKYERIGNLMVKPFRSKHVHDDVYFRHLIQYVHLNPAESFEPGWKQGRVRDIEQLERKLRSYRFSSMPDYFGGDRPEQNILDTDELALVSGDLPSLSSVLEDFVSYYAEIDDELTPHPRGRPKKTQ